MKGCNRRPSLTAKPGSLLLRNRDSRKLANGCDSKILKRAQNFCKMGCGPWLPKEMKMRKVCCKSQRAWYHYRRLPEACTRKLTIWSWRSRGRVNPCPAILHLSYLGYSSSHPPWSSTPSKLWWSKSYRRIIEFHRKNYCIILALWRVFYPTPQPGYTSKTWRSWSRNRIWLSLAGLLRAIFLIYFCSLPTSTQASASASVYSSWIRWWYRSSPDAC